MFLVSDDSPTREVRIRAALTTEPPLAVILGAVHVEWTVRRAILALGRSPNVVLKVQLTRAHGLDQYKDLWKTEVVQARHVPTLPQIVGRWVELRKAFTLRHRLVHGASSCTADYAAPKVTVLIEAAADIRTFCRTQGVDLHARLPIRRKLREGAREKDRELKL
jgi:hypothetical protein